MSGAIAFGLILAAVAVLTVGHGRERILGLDPADFAQLASLIGLGVLFCGWMIDQFRGRWTQAFAALVLWIAMFTGLVGVYSYRDELRELSARVIGEVSPGSPVVTTSGEVVVARRLDGSFTIMGRANDRAVRFIFDTGASTVVLMATTAETLGIRTQALDYVVPVLTANGRTLAAPVVLDSLAVGTITERRVPALVARPGALHENLLGMTFLNRLASYEVRGNRLILRGKAG
jgi:aspartyl protease family protein